MPKSIYAELRVAIIHRERLIKVLIRIKCKIQKYIDKYFPEFVLVFKRWECKAVLLFILKEMALYADISEMNPEEIVSVFKEDASSAVI